MFVFSNVAFVKSVLGDKQKSRRVHLLFIIALADPPIALDPKKIGANVIIVIDDSGSMQASDYPPPGLKQPRVLSIRSPGISNRLITQVW